MKFTKDIEVVLALDGYRPGRSARKRKCLRSLSPTATSCEGDIGVFTLEINKKRNKLIYSLLCEKHSSYRFYKAIPYE